MYEMGLVSIAQCGMASAAAIERNIPVSIRRQPRLPCRACGRHPHRLDVGELANAVLRQLPPAVEALDDAEGQARIRLHHAVDEHGARFNLRGQALGTRAMRADRRAGRMESRWQGVRHRSRPWRG